METKTVAWGRHTIVWVQSENVQEALDVLRNGDADGLGCSPHKGFASEDIAFLADVPRLKGVVLPFAEKYDIRVLERIQGLRFVTVAGNRQGVDYGALDSLEELRVEWHEKLVLPAASARLKALYIRGYKPRTKDFAELPQYQSLTEVEINQGNLSSLEGIECLPKLVSAGLFHLRQLKFVAVLGKTNIERLHVEDCKIIADFESLRECRELKSLRWINCGKLKTLKDLNGFEKLEEFRFVNTIIEDGDMTPLLRMKSVGFLKRSSYSHTPGEIRAVIGNAEA